MSDKTAIEWTDATWNPITGCSVVSPGCTNCYAMKLAGGRLQHHPSRAGLTTPSKAGPVWNGQVRFNQDQLALPLRWTRPRRIFVCAHGDLFHEAVPDSWIDQVFAVMALSRQHTFQVLTKRPERMWAYFSSRARPSSDALYALLHGPMMTTVERSMQAAIDATFPLPNVWLGVSAEDQARAKEDAAELTRLRAENARLREIAQDAVPILDAVLEEREEVIDEEDEVLRDLIDRLRAAIKEGGGE